MNIRQATLKDAPVIAEFQRLMAFETEELELAADTVRAGVEAVLKNPAKGFYLITEESDQPVGCIMITPEWSDWRAQLIWWIQSLYVKREYRETGVFKRMYQYLKDQVRQREDIAGIRLYVDRTNVQAQKVYEALGMNGEHYRTYEWMKDI